MTALSALLPPPRRVVAGRDGAGRSCVAIDDAAPPVIWASDASPADNAAAGDAGGIPFSFDIPVGGSRFIYHDFPPKSAFGMHSSDTLDYLVVVSGEVTFVTETGEAKLAPGDVLVDRGVTHDWRNEGDDPCRILVMLTPAAPVDSGPVGSGVRP